MWLQGSLLPLICTSTKPASLPNSCSARHVPTHNGPPVMQEHSNTSMIDNSSWSLYTYALCFVACRRAGLDWLVLRYPTCFLAHVCDVWKRCVHATSAGALLFCDEWPVSHRHGPPPGLFCLQARGARYMVPAVQQVACPYTCSPLQQLPGGPLALLAQCRACKSCREDPASELLTCQQ